MQFMMTALCFYSFHHLIFSGPIMLPPLCMFADLYISNNPLMLEGETIRWNDFYLHDSGEVTLLHKDKINLAVVVATNIGVNLESLIFK